MTFNLKKNMNEETAARLSVEEVKQYWNWRSKIAGDKSKEKVLWLDRPKWNEYVDKLQMHYLKPLFKQIKPSDTVLDAGCGSGRISFRLAPLCREIWGIDSSEENIKFCTGKAKESHISNAKFKVMDARDLSIISNDMFDWTLTVTSIECITDKNDFISAIKELIRVTKKGGSMILLEGINDTRNWQYLVPLTRDEYFKIIQDCGLNIEYWTTIDVPKVRALIDRIFCLITRYTRKKLDLSSYTDPQKFDTAMLEFISKQKKVNIMIENIVMSFLATFAMPFEYLIPKIYKSPRSTYSLVYIRK